MVNSFVDNITGISKLFQGVGDWLDHSKETTRESQAQFEKTGLSNAINPLKPYEDYTQLRSNVSDRLETVPNVGPALSDAFNIASDPLNLALGAGVALKGARVATALRGTQAPVRELLSAGRYGAAAQSAARRGAANIIEPIASGGPLSAFGKEMALNVSAGVTSEEAERQGIKTPIALGLGLAAGVGTIASINALRNIAREGIAAGIRRSVRPRTGGVKLGVFEGYPRGDDWEFVGPDGSLASLEVGVPRTYAEIDKSNLGEFVEKFQEITDTVMYKPDVDSGNYTYRRYQAIMPDGETLEELNSAIYDWSGAHSYPIRDAITEGTELGQALYTHGTPIREWLRSISQDGVTVPLYRGENQLLYSFSEDVEDHIERLMETAIEKGTWTGTTQELREVMTARVKTYLGTGNTLSRSKFHKPQIVQSYTLDPDIAAQFGASKGVPLEGGYTSLDPDTTRIVERMVPIDDIITALPDFNLKEREFLVMSRPQIDPEALARIIDPDWARPVKVDIEQFLEGEDIYKLTTLGNKAYVNKVKNIVYKLATNEPLTNVELGDYFVLQNNPFIEQLVNTVSKGIKDAESSLDEFVKSNTPSPIQWKDIGFDNGDIDYVVSTAGKLDLDTTNFEKAVKNYIGKGYLDNSAENNLIEKAIIGVENFESWLERKEKNAFSKGYQKAIIDKLNAAHKAKKFPTLYVGQDNLNSIIADFGDNLKGADALYEKVTKAFNDFESWSASEEGTIWGIVKKFGKSGGGNFTPEENKIYSVMSDAQKIALSAITPGSIPDNTLKGVVEGSGDAATSLGGAQGRQNISNEERRQEIRARLTNQPDIEIVRQALEYGMELVDNMDELRDQLSTYIYQGLEEVTNHAQILREYEASFMQLSRKELDAAATARNLSPEGTTREVASRIIDSFIEEAGFTPQQLHLNNPPRANFTDITLTKTPAETVRNSAAVMDEIMATKLPPPYQETLDNLSREFPYTEPEGAFSTPPLGGYEGTFGSEGSGLPPRPPFDDTTFKQPDFSGKIHKEPKDYSNILNQFNQLLKTMWATADASGWGIQALLPMSRLAMKGEFGAIRNSVKNAYLSMLDEKHMTAYLTRHNHVWSQIDPRLNTQWLQSHNLNLASMGGKADISVTGTLESKPFISHANRLFHSTGDLNRLAIVLHEFQLRGGTRLTDEQLEQIIRSANRISGYSDIGIAQNSDLLLFAPRFMASQFEVIVKSFTDGGIEGDIARKSLASLIGIGTGITLSANLARGEETVFDPRDSNFLRIRNVKGHDISVFGPWDSLIRGIARIADDPKEGSEFFIRSKASPVIGVAWDVLSGKTFMGEDVTVENFIPNLVLPFSFKDIGSEPMWTMPLNLLGVKSSPNTPSEILESHMESAGRDPNDPLERRQWLADHPEDRAKGTREDTLYRDAVRDNIRTRTALNDERAVTNQITLTEWRENRKALLTEQRTRLDTIFRSAGERTPSNQKESWIDSYFKLFEESSDEVTNEIISDQFDELLVEWIGVNGSEAYDYVQRYLLTDRSPLETAYLNNLNQLKSLNYFKLPKYRGMVSGSPDSLISDLSRKVSAERALNPTLAKMSFSQASLSVLQGYSMAVRIDVGNAGKQQFQNPQLAQIKNRYPHLFTWFNPNMYYDHYARLSGSPSNPTEMLSLEQQQLIGSHNI